MKGRLNEMKKNTKIAVITFACVIAVAVLIGLVIPKTQNSEEVVISKNTESAKEVTVSINPYTELPKVYEEVTDEETGDTVIAEVQENVPPETKPEKPPEMPVATGDYTNPSAPPVYTEQEIVIDESQKTEVQKEVSVANNSSASTGNKVYVEGFGYVEVGSPTTTVIGTSDGDINKMVGVMD